LNFFELNRKREQNGTEAAPGLKLNEHIVADGPTVFAHACKMGFEGIVAKRKNSPIAADNRRIG
jgi:ATP-dependent DNA ligase